MNPPLWTPAPPPATKLGLQLRLSRFAGVHVSPGRFECNSEHLRQVERAQDERAGQREQLCAAFHAATGNFINTAYKSQHESLEAFIGEVCGCAGESVVATKAGSTRRLVLSGKGGGCVGRKRGRADIKQRTSSVENNLKSLHMSVEEYLIKNLYTSYIDVLHIH